MPVAVDGAESLGLVEAKQLGFGYEWATSAEAVYPANATGGEVGSAWSAFLRVRFDGRCFMGSREDLKPPR